MSTIEELVDADLNCRTGPHAAKLRSERKEICTYIREGQVVAFAGEEGLDPSHVRNAISHYLKGDPPRPPKHPDRPIDLHPTALANFLTRELLEELVRREKASVI